MSFDAADKTSMCEDCAESLVAKGTTIERTLSGDHVIFQIVHHNMWCKEFVVSAPPFSYKKWVLWAAIFNIVGYFLKLHKQVSFISVIIFNAFCSARHVTKYSENS